MKITMTDARRAGYCAAGVWKWFNDHDLDFRDFMKNGIEADKVREIGDGLGLMVLKRKEQDRGVR